ncbi:MAG: hypothetical protein R6V39_09425 [Desulfovibrionales bacterium]
MPNINNQGAQFFDCLLRSLLIHTVLFVTREGGVLKHSLAKIMYFMSRGKRTSLTTKIIRPATTFYTAHVTLLERKEVEELKKGFSEKTETLSYYGAHGGIRTPDLRI